MAKATEWTFDRQFRKPVRGDFVLRQGVEINCFVKLRNGCADFVMPTILFTFSDDKEVDVRLVEKFERLEHMRGGNELRCIDSSFSIPRLLEGRQYDLERAWSDPGLDSGQRSHAVDVVALILASVIADEADLETKEFEERLYLTLEVRNRRVDFYIPRRFRELFFVRSPEKTE